MHQNFKTTKLKKKKEKKLRGKKKCIECMHLGHGDYDEHEWGLEALKIENCKLESKSYFELPYLLRMLTLPNHQCMNSTTNQLGLQCCLFTCFLSFFTLLN